MIVAWFMRYGSLELRTFEDVHDLADILVMLEDAESSTFDQWGCFSFAEDGATGEVISDDEIEAAEERVRSDNAEMAEAYVPPKYSHRIWITDRKGRRHLWMNVTDPERAGWLAGRVEGLGDRVEVEEL